MPEDEKGWEWCQGGGINAGVMLLESNRTMYLRALWEVAQPLHPEHIPGSGSEQDYLGRFYAPWWRHIRVAYNFQMHHVFCSLEACLRRRATYAGWPSDVEGTEMWLPDRMEMQVDQIRVLHFSGGLKMWGWQSISPETGLGRVSDPKL